MWQPTHVQVTVQRVRNLISKGKNGTNDAFVVISLGKEKFQTSIKEKIIGSAEWHEECELAIPSQGNTASIQLTVYHRNSFGLDDFLGQITVPLAEFDVYERPRNRWYRLKGKPDKDKKKGEKERGELEAKISFTVKSGSLTDLAQKGKHKSSLSSLKHIGNRIDKIAIKPKKKKQKTSTSDSEHFNEDFLESKQWGGDADPGVISDEEFGFDEEVKVNTRSSSPYSVASQSSFIKQTIHFNDDEMLSDNDQLPELSSTPLSKKFPIGDEVDLQNNVKSDLPETLSQITSSNVAISFQVPDELDSIYSQTAKINSDSSTIEESFSSAEKYLRQSGFSEAADDEKKYIDNVKEDSVTSFSHSDNLSNKKFKNKPFSNDSKSTFTEIQNTNLSTVDEHASSETCKVISKEKVSSIERSESFREKNSGIQDEWEKKLYGKNISKGSLENVYFSGSRTSLSSHASSTQDVSSVLDDSASRFPEVKALTLERKQPKDDSNISEKKQKVNKRNGLKNRLFPKTNKNKTVEEESRIVEGGNDRTPNPNLRLHREIYDKFVGKSREDLLEMIIDLQNAVLKQTMYARDLEDYIDDLLLRVMEATPQLLQIPFARPKELRFYH